MDGFPGCFSREGIWPKLFRGALFIGRGGSAPVGGSAAGREATGRDIGVPVKFSWNGRSD